MFFIKLRAFAQLVGFLTIMLLMFYGVVSIFQQADHALGAAAPAPAAAAQAVPVAQGAGASSTTVPPYINYQGMLRDPEGKPMSGLHKMTFRIYNDVTAPLPEALWMEEHTDVTVRNGQFSVLLGNNEPLMPALFASPDLFIGVTVDPLDEMTPRQRLSTAPFAMYADHATDLIAPNGSSAAVVHVDAAGRVGVGTTSPQAQLQISSTGQISTALQVNGDSHMNGGLYLNDTSNGNVSLAAGGGRVGIGTNNPLVSLHIAGPDPDIALDIPSASGANEAELRFGVDGVARAALYYNKTTNDTIIANGNGALVIDDQGQNAIGPRLNVNGDLQVTNNLFMSGDRKPVKILRFSNLPDDVGKFWTAVPASDYECTIGGWSTGRYDISEDSRDADKVWPVVEDGYWWVHVKFMSDDEPDETPSVDVICFLKGIVEYDTSFGNREDIGE